MGFGEEEEGGRERLEGRKTGEREEWEGVLEKSGGVEEWIMI